MNDERWLERRNREMEAEILRLRDWGRAAYAVSVQAQSLCRQNKMGPASRLMEATFDELVASAPGEVRT